MAMSSEFQSQLSKSNVLAIVGNMVVKGNVGGGGGTAVFKHQLSPFLSVEVVGTVGLQSLLEVRASRQLTAHTTATMGLAMSLQDGSINLTSVGTRQLSETSNGNIQLLLSEDPPISLGWQKKDEKVSVAGEVMFGTSSLGASGNYTRRFSRKSDGRIAAKVGSRALELEIEGGRKISEFSTIRMLYSVGIQGIFWRFELHRSGQKLIVPNYVVKPYFLKLKQQEACENMERTTSQVKEARAAAEKAQQLLENVANRKKKQSETGGLVITTALYGNAKALKRDGKREIKDDVALQVLDVTLPLNFLVSNSGELKLYERVKKSGIMAFCDPCPGEPRLLHVEYTYASNTYKVDVDDC